MCAAWQAALEDDVARGESERPRAFACAFREARTSLPPADREPDIDSTAVMAVIPDLDPLPFGDQQTESAAPAMLDVTTGADAGMTVEQRIDWGNTAEPLPFRTESMPPDLDPRRSLEAFAALQVDLIGQGNSADIARRYGLERNDLAMVERQWMRHFQKHADDAKRFRRLVAERHQHR